MPGVLYLLLRLGSFPPVASDHNQRNEGADNRRTEEDDHDRNTNGPDSRREERLSGVVLVDKRLIRGDVG